MWSMVRDILRLIRCWWQIDRPRVSPREGRLLRISPPAIVKIGSQLFEVVSRTAGEGPAGPYVVYRCCSGDRSCDLTVELAGTAAIAAISLACGDTTVQLSEDDVEVFGGRFNRRTQPDPQNTR
jgi:hypothetical protein